MAKDLETKNVDKALAHDCAKHVVHEKWGEGNCIPEMHSLEEGEDGVGFVTHYDVMFEHGVEQNVPVEDLEIVVSENHMHSKKKVKEEVEMEEQYLGTNDSERLNGGKSKDPRFRSSASHIDYHHRQTGGHKKSGGEVDRHRYQVAKKLGYMEEVELDEISATKAIKTAVKRETGVYGKAIERGDEADQKGLDKVAANRRRIEKKYGSKAANIADRAAGRRIGYQEALDPVGQEDGDVNNNGIKNDPADKYLKKRRQAVSRAIANKKK